MKRKANKDSEIKQINSKYTKQANGFSFKEKLHELDEKNEEEDLDLDLTTNYDLLSSSYKLRSCSRAEKSDTNKTSKTNLRIKSKSKIPTKSKLLEDIKSSEFNKQLSTLLSIPHSQNIKTNKSKTDNIYHYKEFTYDSSIHKQIELEISIDLPDDFTSEEENSLEKLIINSFRQFFYRNPFSYYEFSNPKGKSRYLNSMIDNINYDFMVQKKDNSLETEIKNKTLIKELNYISAFSSVYRKFVRGEVLNDQYENYSNFDADNFFYLVSPLITYFFFKYEKNEFLKSAVNEIDNSGALLSNCTKNIEKNLKEYGIQYEKLEKTSAGTKNFQNKMDLYSLPNDVNEGMLQNILNPNENYYNSEELIYVKNHFATLLFNMILNDYQDSSINIFAPYPFDSSTSHQCRYTIEKFSKPQLMVIKLVIHGCIFDLHLQKLITFLRSNKSSEGAKDNQVFLEDILSSKIDCDLEFRMKFTPFTKTSNFYKMNKKLNGPLDTVEFTNEKFYIKVLSN
jgi:hypothetical protein